MNDVRNLTLASTLMLVTIGAIMVFSTTVLTFEDLFNRGIWLHYLWLALALAAMFAMTRIPFETIWRARWVIAAASAALLLAVFVPGIGARINGASRWIRLGPVSFQPSEFAKPALVLLCAGLLAAPAATWREDARRFLAVLAVTALAAGLVLIEPDFGTACLLAVLGFGLMFVAGVRLRFLLPSALAGAAALAVLVVKSPYRLRRLVGFLEWR